MIALLIEWNQNTGKRAGNINPKDPKLQCYGWQNMDVTPAIELRVVEDELLYSEHFKEQIGDKKIKITDLSDDKQKRLKELKEKYHIKGIKEIETHRYN